MEKRTKESRKRINSLILLIAFTAIMLIVSTYAWFTTQKDITLSNIKGTIEVVENMEISLDAKNWFQEIDLSEMVDDKTQLQKASENRGDAGTGLTFNNVEPTELLPVSTDGNFANKNFLPLFSGKATGTKLTDVSMINTDGTEAASHGYFAFDIYIKNTSKDGQPDILQLNLNSGVKVLAETLTKTKVVDGNNVTSSYIGDNESGLQNTVRVGLALFDSDVSYAATQSQVLSSTHGTAAKIIDLAIWEPNAPYHTPYILNNNNKIIATGGGTQTLEWDTAMTTHALSSAVVDQDGGVVDNVYDYTNGSLKAQTTFQTDIASKPSLQTDVINYAGTDYRVEVPDPAKPYNITTTAGASDYLEINSNKISRLRVYIWLEGQDVDCINMATHGGGIEVDLGFTKDDEIGEVDYYGKTTSGS